MDLYKLYLAVKSEGGFDKVSSTKSWKKISPAMTKNFRQPYLWRLLQKQYRKYLLTYETHNQLLNQTRSANIFLRAPCPVQDLSQPLNMILSSR